MAKNHISQQDTNPANNTDLGGINIAQNAMLMSSINDAFREQSAQSADFYDDLGGTGTVAGTADAITLTSAMPALATGNIINFFAGADNTGAATINVNGLGAKAIRKISSGSDVDVAAGDILNAGFYQLVYDAAANSAAGAWILTNPTAAGGGGGLSNVVEDTTPQLGGDLDVNGNGIAFPGATVTDVTGADTTAVSGTAGTDGNLAQWNADGDLVDGPAPTGADATYVSGTAGTDGNVAAWNADGDAVDGNKVAADIVTGPGSATDGAMVLFDSTTGKLIKEAAGGAPGTAAFKSTGTSGDAVPLLNAANTFSANTTFTVTTGNTFFDIENPASVGAGTEVRLTQNFNGAVGGAWNSRKARNTAGTLAAAAVNDPLGRFEMRAYASDAVYKTAARLQSELGSTDITGGGNTPSAGYKFLARGSSDTGSFDCTLELMRLGHAGDAYFPQVGTTGSAANAFLDSGSSPANQLLRSTSSARYKTDIEPMESARAEAVMALQPIWYRSTAKADKLPDGTDMSFYGLTAEAVAEVEPRLVSWTWHPDDMREIITWEDVPETIETGKKDKDGKPLLRTVMGKEKRVEWRPIEGARRIPDGVSYERLSVMLLDVVKRERAARHSLEARISALEGRLDALTPPD